MIIDTETKSSETGLFNHNNLKPIKRNGIQCIFRKNLSKNVIKHMFNFLNIRELSEVGSTNIFLYNCFKEYEIPNWKSEMLNIIQIFNLDIKNEKEEIDKSLIDCINKHRLYPMKNAPGNFFKIDKEGINFISLAYYDQNMQFQLDKIKNNNTDENDINKFNFEALELMDLDDEISGINHMTLKTPWEVVYSNNSYSPGNIIFLKEKSTLDFGFSFNNVIRGNYKFYLHQSIIDMRNAKLHIQVLINDVKVLEINNFPSKKILEQFKNEDTHINNDINLKETYICDINEYMFDAVKKNNLKKSLEDDIEIKTSINSVGSTGSSSTMQSSSSIKNINNKRKDYTVRIQFYNSHLFWKAGWYIDGGRLVRSFN